MFALILIWYFTLFRHAVGVWDTKGPRNGVNRIKKKQKNVYILTLD